MLLELRAYFVRNLLNKGLAAQTANKFLKYFPLKKMGSPLLDVKNSKCILQQKYRLPQRAYFFCSLQMVTLTIKIYNTRFSNLLRQLIAT